jgi:hypothetical protein
MITSWPLVAGIVVAVVACPTYQLYVPHISKHVESARFMALPAVAQKDSEIEPG